jgi:intracellular sulfur oxidation DsrE/DsrF family protein
MPLSRKQFVSATALGISAAAIGLEPSAADAQGRAPVSFHILKPTQYDRAAVLSILKGGGAHKQVFQSVSPLVVAPGIASLFLHMQNSMNAYQFSMGTGKLSTLAVVLGPSIILALNDTIWTKYGFGKAFELDPTNDYYKASSNLNLSAAPDDTNGIYQDWSAQAVIKRGGKFFVCHNAMSAVAFVVASKMPGATAGGVLADFEKNLLPGFIIVPAGVAAVQQAQEYGWKPFPII